MPTGRAISLFLIDGVPDGRVEVQLFNWTGKGFRIPRRLLKDSMERADLKKAGVYFLFGKDETKSELDTVYIGEAEEVIKRIPQHGDKEWSDVLIFVSKDDNLNKAHIKYLEFLLHEKATRIGRYRVINGNTPNRPVISEMEQAVMLEFIENLQLLVGTLGYKVFEPVLSPITADLELYRIAAVRGANAQGRLTNDGYVVLKDSRAALTEVPSTPDSIVRLRESLLNEGVLMQSDDALVFMKDHLFQTPSGAAGVILGRSANGWLEWKDGKNRTLKQNDE